MRRDVVLLVMVLVALAGGCLTVPRTITLVALPSLDLAANETWQKIETVRDNGTIAFHVKPTGGEMEACILESDRRLPVNWTDADFWGYQCRHANASSPVTVAISLHYVVLHGPSVSYSTEFRALVHCVGPSACGANATLDWLTRAPAPLPSAPSLVIEFALLAGAIALLGAVIALPFILTRSLRDRRRLRRYARKLGLRATAIEPRGSARNGRRYQVTLVDERGVSSGRMLRTTALGGVWREAPMPRGDEPEPPY